MDTDLVRTTLMALPLPAIGLAEDGRIVALNTCAIELLGADRSNMHYITALRQPSLLDAVEAGLADGQNRTANFTNRAAGRDVIWRVSLRPGPQSVPLILCFEDISPLEQAEQMRRDFVANVSHELRTPLTALLGFIETLRGAAKADAVARERFLGIMANEAGRMSRLVEDLLSLSRVEESERVRPMDIVDLRALVLETCATLQGLAAEAQVRLVYKLGEVPVELAGDEGQLRQVITNLVENGIKYGQSGGLVEIQLSQCAHEAALRGPGAVLVVRDEGDGIASHHIARLTERFYRVDSHRSREVGGTGLGLAIVKHIVNRHRGRLRVQSKPGHGSSFTVMFPIA